MSFEKSLINRREFIKKGFQLTGAGLISSAVGCDTSLTDIFDSASASEAIVVGTTFDVSNNLTSGILYKINLSDGGGQKLIEFFNGVHVPFAVAMRDNDRALVVGVKTDFSEGYIYQVNLNDGGYSTITSLFGTSSGTPISVALENQGSALVGTSLGSIYRVNLYTSEIQQIVSNLPGIALGLALESSNSLLVQNNEVGGELTRVNLNDGSFSVIYSFASVDYDKIAFDSKRNHALIGHVIPGEEIIRIDLNTNTRLASFGNFYDSASAGPGIALVDDDTVIFGKVVSGVGSTGLWKANLDTGVTVNVDKGILAANTSRSIFDIAVRFK